MFCRYKVIEHWPSSFCRMRLCVRISIVLCSIFTAMISFSVRFIVGYSSIFSFFFCRRRRIFPRRRLVPLPAANMKAYVVTLQTFRHNNNKRKQYDLAYTYVNGVIIMKSISLYLLEVTKLCMNIFLLGIVCAYRECVIMESR